MDAAWEVCLTTPTGKRLLEAEAIATKYWREARASTLAALKEVAGIAANKVGHAVRCALCRREVFHFTIVWFWWGGQSDGCVLVRGRFVWSISIMRIGFFCSLVLVLFALHARIVRLAVVHLFSFCAFVRVLCPIPRRSVLRSAPRRRRAAASTTAYVCKQSFVYSRIHLTFFASLAYSHRPVLQSSPADVGPSGAAFSPFVFGR